jgi:hypothetical protein
MCGYGLAGHINIHQKILSMAAQEWFRSANPGVWNNHQTGNSLVVAVGRCDEFSDPTAQFIVRFKRSVAGGLSYRFEYRWIPAMRDPATGEIVPGLSVSNSTSSGLEMASESSYNRCLAYATRTRAPWPVNAPRPAIGYIDMTDPDTFGLMVTTPTPMTMQEWFNSQPRPTQIMFDGGKGGQEQSQATTHTLDGKKALLVLAAIFGFGFAIWIATR